MDFGFDLDNVKRALVHLAFVGLSVGFAAIGTEVATDESLSPTVIAVIAAVANAAASFFRAKSEYDEESTEEIPA